MRLTGEQKHKMSRNTTVTTFRGKGTLQMATQRTAGTPYAVNQKKALNSN